MFLSLVGCAAEHLDVVRGGKKGELSVKLNYGRERAGCGCPPTRTGVCDALPERHITLVGSPLRIALPPPPPPPHSCQLFKCGQFCWKTGGENPNGKHGDVRPAPNWYLLGSVCWLGYFCGMLCSERSLGLL